MRTCLASFLICASFCGCADLPREDGGDSHQDRSEIGIDEKGPQLPQIQWMLDFEAATQEAKSADIPLAAYFTGENCAPCRLAEEKVFPTTEIRKRAPQFKWVKLNLEDWEDPLWKRFDVSGIPRVIVLGRDQVHIMRTNPADGSPSDFAAALDEAKRRWDVHCQGKPWLKFPSRPLCDPASADVQAMPAPREGWIDGLAIHDKWLWLAYGKELHGMPLQAGATPRKSLPFGQTARPEPTRLGKTFLDKRSTLLASSGSYLYSLDRLGDPVSIVNLADQTVDRQIEIDTEWSMKITGLTWARGKLYAAACDEIAEIDLNKGKTIREIPMPNELYWISGLCFDGRHLVTVGAEVSSLWEWNTGQAEYALLLIDPETGHIEQRLDINYPICALAYFEDRFYIAPQPIYDYDEQHQVRQVWPRENVIFQMTLKKEQ